MRNKSLMSFKIVSTRLNVILNLAMPGINKFFNAAFITGFDFRA
jgi:hypothetical protein